MGSGEPGGGRNRRGAKPGPAAVPPRPGAEPERRRRLGGGRSNPEPRREQDEPDSFHGDKASRGRGLRERGRAPNEERGAPPAPLFEPEPTLPRPGLRPVVT